jgi:hypothetical protein
VVIWHTLDAQLSLAFARSQLEPQLPQFDRVSRLVSQPLAAVESQSA